MPFIYWNLDYFRIIYNSYYIKREYERVSLCKVADTPFHIQGDGIHVFTRLIHFCTLKDRSDSQGSNFESCVWRAVSSHSFHHPQEVLLVQFSLYVYKCGLKPHFFHFRSAQRVTPREIKVNTLVSTIT